MTQLTGPTMTGSGGDAAALRPAELPPGLMPGPADRPPLPVGVEVSPASLAMQVKGLGINAVSHTVILNHTASDVPVQIAPDTTDYFDWPSGTFSVPAYGGLPIAVIFEGGNSPGSYRTSVRVVVGQGAEFTVPVIAAVSASGPDK